MTNYKNVAEQAVPGWDNQQAATIFEQMYTQQHGKIDGVLAANDGLGNAAISISQEQQQDPGHRTGRHPAGPAEHPRRHQCMTVFKPTKEEADSLVEVGIALVNGQKPQMPARRSTRWASGT